MLLTQFKLEENQSSQSILYKELIKETLLFGGNQKAEIIISGAEFAMKLHIAFYALISANKHQHLS